MARLTKKQKEARAKVDKNKLYSIEEASSLLKEITYTKFDASVDLAVRLGVDPRKANQMVRGVVSLPHGTGKDMKVLALVTPDKEAEAKEAGADYVGNLVNVGEEDITLEWSSREPKTVGKGKITVVKNKLIAFDQIEKANLIVEFNKL